MPELLWTEVEDLFDPALMGALPDLRIPDTSVEDWQAVLDVVVADGWPYEYSEGLDRRPLPGAETILGRPADAESPQLRVSPFPDAVVIFRFHAETEIDFDVDLRELQGQERLDAFCAFLGRLGRRLGRAVFMDAEGSHGYPVLGFDPEADRVRTLVDPRAG